MGVGESLRAVAASNFPPVASRFAPFALVAALLVGSSAQGSDASRDQTSVFCEYVEAGASGPPGNELRITHDRFAGDLTLEPTDAAIVVYDATSERLDCTGAAEPTVDNIDLVTVHTAPDAVDSIALFPGNRSLAPGATAEADGTPEIELDIDIGPQFGPEMVIVGGPRDEAMDVGSSGEGQVAINLNAAEEAAPDADVTATGLGRVELRLRDGKDRVDGKGGVLFPGEPAPVALVVFPGGGRDVVAAGSGHDILQLHDGTTDRADCGRSRDAYWGDRGDRVASCEKELDAADFGLNAPKTAR